jgi:glycosyltransferase 2 family protein
MPPLVDAARRRGALALRILVSAALLVAVLLYADVGDVLAAVRDGQWGWFAVALAVMAVCVVLGAFRWWLLLEGAGIHVAARDSIRPYAVSFVLNLVLPTAVAGDAVRTWVLGRRSGRLLGAAAATVVDRLTALLCLFAVGWAAYAVDRNAVPGSVLVAFAWLTAGLAVALALAVMAAVGVRPLVHRLPERVAGMIRESWRIVRAWAGSRQLVVSVVALGLVYQVLVVSVFVLAAKTVGVELPFALAAVSTPIVVLATLIPISVGGLGIREGGFVILLGQAGIDAADATVISLLSATTILIASAAVAGATYLFGSVAAEPGVVPPRRSA